MPRILADLGVMKFGAFGLDFGGEAGRGFRGFLDGLLRFCWISSGMEGFWGFGRVYEVGRASWRSWIGNAWENWAEFNGGVNGV